MFAIIFLSIGTGLSIINQSGFHVEIRYDEVCLEQLKKREPCRIDLPRIDQAVEGRVHIYYKLENYYQNHRRYYSSREDQ